MKCSCIGIEYKAIYRRNIIMYSVMHCLDNLIHTVYIYLVLYETEQGAEHHREPGRAEGGQLKSIHICTYEYIGISEYISMSVYI